MEAESSCQKIAGASKKAHSSLIQVSWAEFLTVELVFAKMTEEEVTDLGCLLQRPCQHITSKESSEMSDVCAERLKQRVQSIIKEAKEQRVDGCFFVPDLEW